MSKTVKIIGLSLLTLLVLIQFFRIDTTNPPVDPSRDFINLNTPPAEIATLIRQTCYDCHSNEVIYPWYANVAPVSWWIRNHVEEGREHLNFSTWGANNGEDRGESIEECAEEISKGGMPLASYTWIHKEARLSADQRRQLSDWFNSLPGSEGGEAGTHKFMPDQKVNQPVGNKEHEEHGEEKEDEG